MISIKLLFIVLILAIVFSFACVMYHHSKMSRKLYALFKGLMLSMAISSVLIIIYIIWTL
jgi:hypothetical protein